MTGGLTVARHDARTSVPPDGWQKFVAAQGLPAYWDWAIVHAYAMDRGRVVAATILDGNAVRGLVTGRFVGPAVAGRPLAGVVELTGLYTSADSGLVLDDESLAGDAVDAVRHALGQDLGARLRGLLLRRVTEQRLPAMLRWPAVVREGGPIAVFHNVFTDFDAYLSVLKKKRRHFVRRTLRDIDGDRSLSIRFTGRGDPRVTLPLARVRLLGDSVVARNHRVWWLRKPFMTPALTRAALTHPGIDRFTYHQGEELLAYALLWRHPDMPHIGQWGAESVEASGRRDLWFHFVASTIRWCVESGRAGLVGGQGSLRAKARLGFDLTRQWTILIPR